MRTRTERKWWRLMALVAAIGLLAAACGGDGDDGDGDGQAGEGGQTVSLLHGISGENEQAALQQAVDAYEEASGNTVEVEASPDFETIVVTRVTGGNPPDVALYPQPGLLRNIANQDAAVGFDSAGVELDTDNLVPGMVETGTFDGTTYGVVVKLGMKSLLWYAADDFGDYDVPDSWTGLVDLTDTIASDLEGEQGRAPWCIGIESGGATGWVATDWIEDLVLRLHGPDVYDQWVNHEIMFNSPEITEAFEALETIWFNENYVLGGTTGILQTPFGDAAAPMFDDPPGCFLHRQAGFITGSFPEDAELGSQYGMAYFPSDEGQPVLFAGDLAAIHSDNPVAADFVEFLTSTEGQEAWMSHDGAGSLAVRSDFDSGNYPTEALAQQGEILSNATVARFDASDLMPSEVGAEAFWTEIVAWLSGQQELEATLSNIDEAWPSE